MKTITTFEAGLRKRILSSRFLWITTFGNAEYDTLWWCHKTRQWKTEGPFPEGSSTCCHCRSYKAFRRHLRKHAAQLQGYEVVLVHRFEGYNVEARVWK